MQWNGKPGLLRGSKPRWKFTARCVSLGTFPQIGFGYTNDGGLTFILCPPNGLLVGTNLDFEVVARGPEGKELPVTFKGVIVDPPVKSEPSPLEPKLVEGNALQLVGIRRPPYELKYITEDEWNNPLTPCFQGGGVWSDQNAGCFLEPTETQPLLLLVINEDMGLLKSFCEGLVEASLMQSALPSAGTVTSPTSHFTYIRCTAKKSGSRRQGLQLRAHRSPQ